MTAQQNDTISFKGQNYSLVAIEGQGLFEPLKHGFRVVHASSCLWRGYVIHYEVAGDRLILSNVTLHLSFDESAGQLFGVAPKGGEWPGKMEPGWDWGSCIYEGLTEPMEFSGKLLLGSGFINELYVHMGFHPGWKYTSVVELSFVDGHLVEVVDRSMEMAKVRQDLRNQPLQPDPKAKRNEIKDWISHSFSRSFPNTPIEKTLSNVFPANEDPLRHQHIRYCWVRSQLRHKVFIKEGTYIHAALASFIVLMPLLVVLVIPPRYLTGKPHPAIAVVGVLTILVICLLLLRLLQEYWKARLDRKDEKSPKNE